MIKHIIWDWNGTLLDDLDVSMEALNYVLEKENLPLVLDKEEYRKYFQFPVIEYYKKVGFDFNKTPFSVLAKQYMDYYQPNSLSCSLHKNVEETLQKVRSKDVSQYLLSASNLDFLHEQLAEYDIKKYFLDIKGLDNIHAHSKAELAKCFVEESGFNPDEVLFVGDSVHDSEVAKYANCHCLLIANGHEHKSKLLNTDSYVVDNMKQFYDFIVENIK